MSDSAQPGWYHAQGDPAGTERYWDGSAWTEGPRPVGGVPSAPAANPQPQPTDMPTFGGTPAGGMPSTADTVPTTPQPAAMPGGFPGAPPAAPAMAGGTAFGTFPESSQATTALVLSCIGFFCGLTAPFGLYMGLKEKKAIDQGRRDPKNRGMSVAAIVIGGLVTALMVLSFLFLVVAVIASA